MQDIAKVIVDVPTMQTDKPYDYAIPTSFDAIIAKGSRVAVPFGKGGRIVQGFVVDIVPVDKVSYDGQLKDIAEVMDIEPVLNAEMLQLGKAMADETFSFLISNYQTILPQALRATYDKTFYLIDDVSEEIYSNVFEERDEISWQEAEERDLLKVLQKLQREKKVAVHYEVGDKRTYKKVRHIKPALSFDDLEIEKEQIAKNANKQLKLLNLLQGLEGKSVPLKTVIDHYNIGRATITTANERGWLDQKDIEVYRDPYGDVNFTKTKPLTLNNDQQNAYEAIVESSQEEKSDVFLLEGITGSGKTEVYLQVIADVLESEQTAIVLVPEIALTPQMVNRFKGRFGERVAVMHSGLSNGERFDEWRRITEKKADVVIGARSSIFAPLENIGVIIIDEEHESSYKSGETPRYHARDVAKWRGEYHHAPIVLGSATPSLESRARAMQGVYKLLKLNERPTGQQLPEVAVIDLKEEMLEGNHGTFSRTLVNEMTETIDRGEQVVLLLNRRGYSSFVMCRDCGYIPQCPNCDISLTLHMDNKQMKCHYCGHEEAIPHVCPVCHSSSIRYYGTGTQKVEEELKKVLPESKILRMDRDTTRKKGSHARLLNKFGNQEADILLGTQMIAKGLDFPNVTLVGVLNADTALNLPDFRSSENTYQLLTQVSGRAGRGDKPGRVIVQTYNPKHYAIQIARQQDYELFFKYEMNYRNKGNYPPYFYTIRIAVNDKDEGQAAKVIQQLANEIKPTLSKEAVMLGPTPRTIARIQNRYHFQILIKYKSEPALYEMLMTLMTKYQGATSKGLRISIDPEPLNFV